MRIAILTIGSRGDVHPYVALGVALRRRGHSVRIVTGRGFGDVVEAAGLDYGEIGFDFQQLISDPDLKAALRSLPALVRAFRDAGEMVDVSLRDSWAACRDAEAVIYHPKAIAAPHIAEKLRCAAILAPVVPFGVTTDAFESPLLPLRSFGPVTNRMNHRVVDFASTKGFASRIARFRSDTLGLDPTPSRPTNVLMVKGRPAPKVFGFSRYLVPMPADAHGHVTTGYWFNDSHEHEALDADLATFLEAGDPPIYFGFGSMAGDRPENTAGAVVQALERIGRRGVLSRGWGGLDPREVPGHIHVVDETPHDLLLPRCAAVVHHGGSGTTHRGLRHGRPTLIRPVFGDQPFWGRRVAAAVAGPPPIREKNFHGARLDAALMALLDERFADGASAISEAMLYEPGADGAAEAVQCVFNGDSKLRIARF